MIKVITLTNFMSHKFSQFKFGLNNAIVGPNDSGKSSVFHAIRWVMLNDPRGDWFIHSGESECSVVIETDKGYVSKTRSGKQTIWDVNAVIYETSEQPPTLGKVLKFDDISFIMQHDSPFLISYSAAEAAKLIGDVSELSLYDRIVEDLIVDLGNAKYEVDEGRFKLSLLEDKLQNYKDVELMEELLNKVETTDNDCILLKERRDKISLSSVQHAVLKNLVDILKSKVALIQYDCVTIQSKETEALLSTRKSIVDWYEKYTDANNVIEICKNRVGLFIVKEDAELGSLIAKHGRLMAIYEKMVENQKCSKSISTKLLFLEELNAIQMASRKVAELQSRIESIKVIYKKYSDAVTVVHNLRVVVNNLIVDEKTKKDLRSQFVGTICPECNQVIKEV